ncbi:MAG: hypothetical protein ACLQGP_36870 [Isosphaeraceae bacterium]
MFERTLDHTQSDPTQGCLCIEMKVRVSSSFGTLWEYSNAKARRESRTPVLMLHAEGKLGALIVVRGSHLAAVVAEFATTPVRAREPPPSLEDPEPFHP